MGRVVHHSRAPRAHDDIRGGDDRAGPPRPATRARAGGALSARRASSLARGAARASAAGMPSAADGPSSPPSSPRLAVAVGAAVARVGTPARPGAAGPATRGGPARAIAHAPRLRAVAFASGPGARVEVASTEDPARAPLVVSASEALGEDGRDASVTHVAWVDDHDDDREHDFDRDDADDRAAPASSRPSTRARSSTLAFASSTRVALVRVERTPDGALAAGTPSEHPDARAPTSSAAAAPAAGNNVRALAAIRVRYHSPPPPPPRRLAEGTQRRKNKWASLAVLTPTTLRVVSFAAESPADTFRLSARLDAPARRGRVRRRRRARPRPGDARAAAAAAAAATVAVAVALRSNEVVLARWVVRADDPGSAWAPSALRRVPIDAPGPLRAVCAEGDVAFVAADARVAVPGAEEEGAGGLFGTRVREPVNAAFGGGVTEYQRGVAEPAKTEAEPAKTSAFFAREGGEGGDAEVFAGSAADPGAASFVLRPTSSSDDEARRLLILPELRGAAGERSVREREREPDAATSHAATVRAVRWLIGEAEGLEGDSVERGDDERAFSFSAEKENAGFAASAGGSVVVSPPVALPRGVSRPAVLAPLLPPTKNKNAAARGSNRRRRRLAVADAAENGRGFTTVAFVAADFEIAGGEGGERAPPTLRALGAATVPSPAEILAVAPGAIEEERGDEGSGAAWRAWALARDVRGEERRRGPVIFFGDADARRGGVPGRPDDAVRAAPLTFRVEEEDEEPTRRDVSSTRRVGAGGDGEGGEKSSSAAAAAAAAKENENPSGRSLVVAPAALAALEAAGVRVGVPRGEAASAPPPPESAPPRSAGSPSLVASPGCSSPGGGARALRRRDAGAARFDDVASLPRRAVAAPAPAPVLRVPGTNRAAARAGRRGGFPPPPPNAAAAAASPPTTRPPSRASRGLFVRSGTRWTRAWTGSRRRCSDRSEG